MRNKLLLVNILLFPIIAFSQTQINPSQNARRRFSHASQIQLETLGPGGLLSFHFDSRFRRIVNGPGYSVGIGYAPYGLFEESCNSGGVITIPAGLNYLFGDDHYFEIGAGGVLKFGGGTKVYCPNIEDGFFENEGSFYAYTLLGYRYQPLTKKITIRAFVSPLFQKDFPIKFWGGASIGIRLD